MKLNLVIASSIGSALVLMAPMAALADTTALAASCSGSATSSGVTWSASSTGGVSPVAYLWGNGSTATSQTVSYAAGTYSMTLQATDASSTVATATCSATVGTGSSSNSTLDQINALLAQIAALKQQISQLAGGLHNGDTASSTPSVGGHACPMPNRNLGIGSRGDDVKQIQQYLADNDSEDFATTSVTGFFGQLTANAMKHFQEKNGIASSTTGFVGPMTRGFFGKHCGEIEGKGHLNGTTNPWMNASTTMPSIKPPHKPENHASSTGDGNNSDH